MEEETKELITVTDTGSGGQVSVPVEPAKLHSNVIREILLADTEAVEITVPRLPSCEAVVVDDEKVNPSSFGYLDRLLRPFLADDTLQSFEWTGNNYKTHGTWARLREKFYASVIKTAAAETLGCYLETSNYLDVNVLTWFLAREYARRVIEDDPTTDVVNTILNRYQPYDNRVYAVKSMDPWYAERMTTKTLREEDGPNRTPNTHNYILNLHNVSKVITPEFYKRNEELLRAQRPDFKTLGHHVQLNDNPNFSPEDIISMQSLDVIRDNTLLNLDSQPFAWFLKNYNRPGISKLTQLSHDFGFKVKFVSIEEVFDSLNDERFYWKFSVLSENPTVLPAIEAYPLLESIDYKRNENIYPERDDWRWDWYSVSWNPGLTQAYIEHFMQYRRPLRWDIVSQHACLSWSFVERHRDDIEWNWTFLSENPALMITPEILERNMDIEWDWSSIAHFQQIPPAYVVSKLDDPRFEWLITDVNPKLLTPQFILEHKVDYDFEVALTEAHQIPVSFFLNHHDDIWRRRERSHYFTRIVMHRFDELAEYLLETDIRPKVKNNLENNTKLSPGAIELILKSL